jgi:thiamine pyrophosphokinase
MGNHQIKQLKMACIFCKSELKNIERAKCAADHSDLLIAVDGGTKHLTALGLKPDILVGEIDTDAPNETLKGSGIVRIPCPPDKNKSDVEAAVQYAFEQGCEQVVLLEAIGGRLDYTLKNVALAARYPGRLAIIDGTATLVAVDRSERCMLHGEVGSVVSLIPYGPGRPKVRTKGLKYLLEDEPLAFVTQGLSNELSQAEACVCVSEGILLVYIDSGEVCPERLYEQNKEKGKVKNC